MSDLLWPGDHRAGEQLTDASLVRAMVAVESAWLDAIAGAGIAPASARADLEGLVTAADAGELASGSESSGNPVVPLVALLRERAPGADAGLWLHRGLTSQDVLDTALMLAARDALDVVRRDLRAQVRALADLVETHRGTPMVARTLTQHAVPTTFGLKAAQWLTGILDAYDDVATLRLPVQVGGAAGTMAAIVELADAAAAPVPAVTDLAVVVADRLGLTPSTPWHTTRTPITRLGDAAVRCTDAWGRLANDVLTLSRPEIGELSEGAGGGSSTMPHKANPALSVQVRRAALAAPQLGATLHLAAAESLDERSDGAWHAEWATLRTLLRRTVVAGSQATELLAGLKVHTDSMATRLASARDAVRAEQRSMADLAGTSASGDYLGAADAFLEAPLARAAGILAEEPPP